VGSQVIDGNGDLEAGTGSGAGAAGQQRAQEEMGSHAVSWALARAIMFTQSYTFSTPGSTACKLEQNTLWLR
jgi:hypothetical protein